MAVSGALIAVLLLLGLLVSSRLDAFDVFVLTYKACRLMHIHAAVQQYRYFTPGFHASFVNTYDLRMFVHDFLR